MDDYSKDKRLTGWKYWWMFEWVDCEDERTM